MKRLLSGLALLIASILGLLTLQHRAAGIRAANTSVTAEVMGQHGHRQFKVLRVEYVYGARNYRTDLLDIGWSLPPGSGAQITLAINPAHPSEATAPGLVSGSAWRYWYQPVGTIGLCLLLAGAWNWFRSRRRGTPPEVKERLLVHPHPARQDRANGKIMTFVLFPGNTEPPWEEELPVRHLTPGTAEICCVPFLQTRLALGDIVELNARGYTGAVATPSGWVTFALRLADPASSVRDVHELINEFPGTTIEEVGSGLLAVAGSTENAEEIHTLLRSWEQQGRVTYRCSVLRTDQVDTPLL
jgi:hypothetical protein